KGTLVLLYHDCDNIRLRLTEIHLPLSLVLSPSRLEVGDFFRRKVKTSIYIYIVPVITVVTSIIVLHEEMTWLAAFGTILTLTGLFISESKINLKNKGEWANGYTK
ncbi:EamA family transporter, partial [Aneurinibacillus aneurinilyticus]